MIASAAELGIVALKALLRYRTRVDEILVSNELQRGLPFRLPAAPSDTASQFAPMLDFFQRSDAGRAALALRGLTAAYEKVAHASETGAPPQAETNALFALYFELGALEPRALAPGAPAAAPERAGSSDTVRLAYWIVESHRLSRNPAWTRLLLAAADTLLETVGENAGLFVSDPRTRGFVETLIHEFAGTHDFDDDTAERIARRLLGSAAIAAFEHRGQIPERPVVAALAGALGDAYAELRKDPTLDAADFFAGLVQGDRFDHLVASFLTQVSDDPRFLASDALARDVVTATLRHVAKDVPALRTRPDVVLGALEAALAAGASHVDTLLGKRLGDVPVAALALGAVARAVEDAASRGALVRAAASGDLVPQLYAVALRAIAARPDAIAADLDPAVAPLVAGVADALADAGPAAALDRDTLHAVVSSALTAAAEAPSFLTADAGFAGRLVATLARVAGPLAKDGLGRSDLAALAAAAVRASAERLALGRNDALGALLGATASALSTPGASRLLDARSRREALIGAIAALAANPALWTQLAQRDGVAPLVEGLVAALAGGIDAPLAGAGLAEAIERCLRAVSQHGAALAAGTLDAGAVKGFAARALAHGTAHLGRGLDLAALPGLLEQSLAAQLESDPAAAATAHVLDDALARVVARL